MDDAEGHVPPSSTSDALATGAQLERRRQMEQIDAVIAADEQTDPDYLRSYFDLAAVDLLRERSPADLATVASRHLEVGRCRAAGQTRVEVRPPADPMGEGSQAFATLDSCTEDMPYVVDTALIAARELGATIDWAVHPVLRIQRDADDRMVSVNPATAETGVAESWVHLEFEPLADPAAYEALRLRLADALDDLRQLIRDEASMRARAMELAQGLQQVRIASREDDFNEARAFLEWLLDQRFVFFGYSESCVESDASGAQHFVEQPELSLGLCRPGERYSDIDALIAPREELNRYAESTRVVVITKANRRAHIHMDEYLDLISVKRFDANGVSLGTSRFLGLFSSDVYIDRPRTIPILRRKVESVLARARYPEESFSGRYLRDIMYLLPREELFQSSNSELFDTVNGIRVLRERHQLKLFVRRDRYGRFYSCMIYLPRERYSRELRERLEQQLVNALPALSVDRQIDFFRGGMARIRYVVRTPAGTELSIPVEDLERRLRVAARTWREQLREALAASASADSAALFERFADAFPLRYTTTVPPIQATEDLRQLGALSEARPLIVRLMVTAEAGVARATQFKLYTWATPPTLSDVLPTLENFGFCVISQTPTPVNPRNGGALWINEFEIQAPPSDSSAERLQSDFEIALLKVWEGALESDRLNRLLLTAGLQWRQLVCLRMLSRYVNQIGLPYGRSDIDEVLSEHPDFAALLVRLFEARFDPAQSPVWVSAEQARLSQQLTAALDAVVSLHADRVLRALLSVVHAALRTNYFQTATGGGCKPYISLKLDPSQIPELPLPRPMFEVWVYAPEVEGVHLRGGRVARGGLRWSDRREDFRTEILGLMKAQRVKNAVIVPVGAKGGFVVKQPVDPQQRERYLQQGVACYQTFLRGVLDLTDNRVGEQIVPPAQVVCYDPADPYLVVAADKGTASFSDIANGVAAERGFWLGDAFASGGSRGYDHKKMGITARGAWESVKRHFRELERLDADGIRHQGRDIQSQPFTVVGIGDMSGDVFGNGMLLSRQIRLLAAFDHRHIFIDPDPDAERSFVERERLFHLQRSSWSDYDSALLSAGGGIYPRSAKSIALSVEARAALGIEASVLTPTALISALLRAPVDLLWNGGVGTYVKASDEGHDQAGDKTNDVLRVNGRELRCLVVGEGGNLGLTQRGRIEYALHGGRINTDAIDNSAGVHTSDREVNIKIPLNVLMAAGQLDYAVRDPILEHCTEDVAAAVLRENYLQPVVLSLEQQQSVERLDSHVALMRLLEREGALDRNVEALPDDDAIKERRKAGLGLTRPELAVLVAYAKISLYEHALAGDLPDEPALQSSVLRYFPPTLVKRFPEVLQSHRLRREIISTQLSNQIVDRMGAGFAHLLADDLGVPLAAVMKAYAAGYRVYDSDRYWDAIEALDLRVPVSVQYGLLSRISGLLKYAADALLCTQDTASCEIDAIVGRYGQTRAQLEAMLPEVLSPSYREDWEAAAEALREMQLSAAQVTLICNTRVLGAALPIAELVRTTSVSVEEAAQVYFLSGDRFQMLWIHAAVLSMPARGRWQALARSNLRNDAYQVHHRLAEAVLREPGVDAQAHWVAWCERHGQKLDFVLSRLKELQAGAPQDFMALQVAVRELQSLCI